MCGGTAHGGHPVGGRARGYVDGDSSPVHGLVAGGSVPPTLTARQQMLGVSVLVVVLTAVATAWAHWLDPRMNVGVMPATGVLLAALLVLEPRYWALPFVAGGASRSWASACSYGLELAAAGAPAVAALVGSLVGACALRAYARGSLHVARGGRRRALAVLGAGFGAFAGAAAGVAVAKPGTPRSTTGRGRRAPGSPTRSVCSSSRPRCSSWSRRARSSAPGSRHRGR